MPRPVIAADFRCTTKRLVLRPLHRRDKAAFVALYTDPDTMRHIGVPLAPEHARREFRAILQRMQQRPPRSLCLVVRRHDDDRPLGICAVSHLDVGVPHLEIGAMLAAPARNAGIGSEAKAALISRLFERLPVDEIRVEFRSDHVAAERCNRKIGFSASSDPPPAGSEPGTWRLCVHRQTWLGSVPARHLAESSPERGRCDRASDGEGMAGMS